jgi:predicted ATP-grasp superfamily ATP-dependent carboligase
MIYLSLEHELIARNNMIYPFIKFRNVDIDEAKKIVKTSFINKSFVLLEEFDYNMFINSIDKDELVKLTNIFNKEVLNQTDIITDVVEFYKKWEDFFKQTSIEWRKEIDNEIDRLYEFIDTNEFILHSYHQNMIGFAQKVLIEVYKNKIKKWKII